MFLFPASSIWMRMQKDLRHFLILEIRPCNKKGCFPNSECRCGGRCGNEYICDEQAKEEWSQYPICTGACVMRKNKLNPGEAQPAFRYVEWSI